MSPSDPTPPDNRATRERRVTSEAGSRASAARLRAWLEPLGDRARRSPRYQWWVLWVSLSGLLATNLLFTVFVVALPEVSRSLHASVGTTTWVVTGPLLAYGVVAPLVGKAGDLFGHRRLFMTGIMAETVAAALSALACLDPPSRVSRAVHDLRRVPGASAAIVALLAVNERLVKHSDARDASLEGVIAALHALADAYR